MAVVNLPFKKTKISLLYLRPQQRMSLNGGFSLYDSFSISEEGFCPGTIWFLDWDLCEKC
jgi:hypothetical protein